MPRSLSQGASAQVKSSQGAHGDKRLEAWARPGQPVTNRPSATHRRRSPHGLHRARREGRGLRRAAMSRRPDSRPAAVRRGRQEHCRACAATERGRSRRPAWGGWWMGCDAMAPRRVHVYRYVAPLMQILPHTRILPPPIFSPPTRRHPHMHGTLHMHPLHPSPPHPLPHPPPNKSCDPIPRSL